MPLEVICINDKGTKKLVKDQKYVIVSLFEVYHNSYVEHNGKKVKARRVAIEGLSSYGVERFRLTDGRNFYDVPLFQDNYWSDRLRIDDSKDYTGQYIVCRWDGSSKYLKKDQIYKVKEHRKETTWGNRISSKFKIEGLKGNFYNAWHFDEIPLKEQRKIKLQNINGDNIETGIDKRKFLFYKESEKDRILLEVLLTAMKNMESVEDKTNASIIDFMLKSGYKYNIVKEDITPFLRKTLNKILEDNGLL